VHDLWVLNPFRDLIQKHRMPDRVKGNHYTLPIISTSPNA
jgi:hypothetical protein